MCGEECERLGDSLVVAGAAKVDRGAGGEEGGGSHCIGFGVC